VIELAPGVFETLHDAVLLNSFGSTSGQAPSMNARNELAIKLLFLDGDEAGHQLLRSAIELAQPIAPSADVEHGAAMRQAIEDRGREHLVAGRLASWRILGSKPTSGLTSASRARAHRIDSRLDEPVVLQALCGPSAGLASRLCKEGTEGMRIRISTVAAVLMLGLIVGSVVNAQVRVTEKANVAATGEITAIDAAARSVTVKSTNDEGVVYVVDESATIMKGATKLALGDLQKGWSVAVNGHDDGTRKLLTFIKVVKAPTP